MVEGRVWYNSTADVIKYYDGSSIKVLATGGDLTSFIDSLESTAGAGIVGTLDSGNYFTATTVEGTLQEVGESISSINTDITDIQGELETINGRIDDNDSDIAGLESSKVSKSGDSMSGNLSFGGIAKVTGLAAPTDDADAATKLYVDTMAQGVSWKEPVKAATSGDVVLNGEQTVDGVSLVAGDRVLVKAQSDATENGIYVVASGAWVRSTDADNNPVGEIQSGSAVFVEDGSTYKSCGFVVTTTGEIVIGTTEIDFVQFTGLGQIVAGAGIKQDGNEIYLAFGAGIKELPTDEIGLDVSNVGGLFLTEDGTTESGAADAKLAIKVDATAGDLTLTADGIKISDAFKSSISGDVSDLQDEVDAIETAVGLNADGTIVPFVSANYISSATIIASSISMLDGALKTTSDGLAQEITDRTTAVSGLQSQVDDIVIDVSNLSDDLAQEVIDRGAADTTLQGNIDDLSDALDQYKADVLATTGATLVGVDTTGFGNSSASTLQTTLANFDAAISAAGKRAETNVAAVLNGTSGLYEIEYTHGLGYKYVSITIYDENDEVIIPNSIVAVDANNVKVTFTSAITATLKIVA